ncbi:diacylglycerol/lipid kinase family protein [Variovorax saccharolyticus]|uniref:diacylglycerol/lipid kinase family protein n=1 Tax=Variovorax saccharolyticus TaxID=3053516 RepID=UPI00257517D6|nr:diacylglycerol kinase family protein [Variovorax sp. J31P216]MDM0029662.1 diacylglycerol kinase family protein [Variovorax sp. J31P216]
MTPPEFSSRSPLLVVLNAGSGSGEALRTRGVIAAGCAAVQRDFHVYEVEAPDRLHTCAREAVKRARILRGVVVAAGGDGTINAVAQAALGSGCAFGVLPQGTFNYFSRTHGIPSDTAEALQVLLHESPRAVQVGMVNERVFLVNASLGLYAKLLEDREAFKAQYGRHRWVAFCSGLLTILRGARPWYLHMSWHGQQRDIRTQTLFVANNALQMHRVGLAEADAPEQGQLAAIALKPQGAIAMLSLLARGALGRLGEAESLVSFTFESMKVRPMRGRRRVKVATDGEIGWLDMPLDFRVSLEPLWLIRPDVAPELEATRQ